jgi:hypothetical protein
VPRAIGLLVSVALLAGCASTIEHPVPGGPSFEDSEVRFVAPTGWQLQPSTSLSYGPSQIRLYLANQPLRRDCDAELVCQSALPSGLLAGGMYVVWTTDTCVAKQCELPAATLISIGNRQGVRVPMTHLCEGTGFTERSAYYVTVTPQRVDILFTCARNPSDATRSAFLGFLDAIQWRIP